MAEGKETSMHWVIGIILLITGVLIIAALVVTYSQGQTNSNIGNIEANVNISGSAPVITTYAMWKDDGAGSESTLAQGTTAIGVVGGAINVILNVNVTDTNGYNDKPINVSARIVRTKDAGANVNTRSGSANPFTFDDSIDVASLPQNGPTGCTLMANFNAGSGVNTGGTWRCPIQLFYVSDPTAAATSVNSTLNYTGERWNFLVEASDTTATVPNYALTYFEFDNILGLSAQPTLFLGAADTYGNPTTSATPLNIENKGNQQMDFALEVNQTSDGAAWDCVKADGVTPQAYNPLVSDIHYAMQNVIYNGTINGTIYNGMSVLNLDLSGSGTNEASFDLDRSESTVVSSYKREMFTFATKQAIAKGNCTLSSMIFTAKKAY